MYQTVSPEAKTFRLRDFPRISIMELSELNCLDHTKQWSTTNMRSLAAEIRIMLREGK